MADQDLQVLEEKKFIEFGGPDGGDGGKWRFNNFCYG